VTSQSGPTLSPASSHDERLERQTPESARRLSRLASGLGAALPPLSVVVTLLALWEGYVEASGIDAVTLPAPTRILDAGFRNRDLLLDHGVVTLYEALVGLAVAIAVGLAFALLVDSIGAARRALYPLLVGSQTVPVVVIAPLLVIWFGFGLTPKVLVVALYTFFPITVAFASGLAATDKEALILMYTLGAGRLQTLRLLRVPQALPYFFTGLRIAATYAVVGAVFAEWSGAREGLGIFVLLMKNSFRTDLVFAAIFVIAGLSLLLFAAVGALEKAIVRWR